MKTEKLVLNLPGLKCAPCVPDIEGAVRSVDGVIWAVLSYAAEEISIIHDPGVVSSRQLLQFVRTLHGDPSLQGARAKEPSAQVGGESRPAPHYRNRETGLHP